MAVYVDIARYPYGRMLMCHMMADTPDELHSMADTIGVSRRHFQARSAYPHYDICKAKRSLAVQAGAIETTAPMMCRWWREKKEREMLDNLKEWLPQHG